MRLIVGLGNPGRRYDGTRHNVGFEVVDRFAARHGASFREGKGEFLVAQTDLSDIPVVLIKPTTFMNNSGLAVEEATRLFDVTYADTLIVFDDFQLPLGTIRLRAFGTDGGHNGMASVIYHAGTDEIARIRCGIGSESMGTEKEEKTSFVLSPFDMVERSTVGSMVERAAEGIATYIRDGADAAMNVLNRKPESNN